MEKKAPKAECQLSFDSPPSYLALLNCIEQEPTALKLQQVNYHIKAGKEYMLQDNWMHIVGDEGAINLTIIPQKAKPLSSFTNEEGMKLLMGPIYQEAETEAFAMDLHACVFGTAIIIVLDSINRHSVAQIAVTHPSETLTS
ncbi:TPA: hypothetical protein ACH3X1_015880 [Trebouxia sp. C0004]